MTEHEHENLNVYYLICFQAQPQYSLVNVAILWHYAVITKGS